MEEVNKQAGKRLWKFRGVVLGRRTRKGGRREGGRRGKKWVCK